MAQANSSEVMDENSFEQSSWKTIGAGGFSQVYKARHHRWGRDVAIKLLWRDDGSSHAEDLAHEYEAMLRADCPFIMRALGVFKGLRPPGSICVGLVMDLMERGSLSSLQDKRKRLLPWPLVFRLAHQVALGMNYLHSLTPALIHKDLKPQNILLDACLNVKITDFGIAKYANSDTLNHLKGVNTAFFAPPELGPATCAYDVYSYAILVWTILNPGYIIERGEVSNVVRPSLEDVKRMQAPGLDELVKLIVRCWNQNPDQRPSFKECTDVTEGLFEKHKSGIDDAVHQVQKELVVENLRPIPEAKLVGATARLQEMCSIHNEPIKVYCRTDQQCICILCAMDHHKGHDTVSALAERTDKQKEVVTSQQKVQQNIQKIKKELNDLRPSIETLKSSAEAAVDASDKIFCEMIASVERRRSEVKDLIRDQGQTAVAHAEGFQRQLEEQIAQLERRNAELEELSSTDDVHFIQSFRSLSMSTGSPASPSIVLRPLKSFTDVSDAVSGLRDNLEDILKTTWPQISDRGVLLRWQADSLMPQTRKDLSPYVCELTLDPNTAAGPLSLSENNRKVTCVEEDQKYPDHPDRFKDRAQVMCRESLIGRCYWEVEWSRWVEIAVTYRAINRQGGDTGFGWNAKSWSLVCNGDKSYTVYHNKKHTVLPVSPSGSNRVGVYVDWPAGTLSFYRMSSDTLSLTHLHTVQSTFTEPLYAGFGFGFGFVVHPDSSVSLCQREEEG